MNDVLPTDEQVSKLQRQVRIVVILAACNEAGITPISVLRFHTVAYLTNVLAPVWNMPALEGKILKRQGGPFYPALQSDVDRLVGRGVVTIQGLNYKREENDRWRIEGAYELNYEMASPILEQLRGWEHEYYFLAFVRELAFAVSALSENDFDAAMTEDATYSDPVIDVDNVIDFAEWKDENFAANAANHFGEVLPYRGIATPGERIHLYVRHIHSRLQRKAAG